MSWYPQTDAAALMNISTRTLRRRIRAGEVNARREGRNVLIELPERREADREVDTSSGMGNK